jgi:cytochrome c-type biogenesis protein
VPVDALFEAFYGQASTWINAAARGVETLPVSYAFGAGMLASVNPCGFIMLPAFAAFFVTTTNDGIAPGRPARLMRAAWMGALVTLAFIAVFTLAGALVWAGGRALMAWSSWAGAAVGVALLGFGLYQLATRRSLFSGATSGLRIARRRSNGGVLLFGAGYAVCSLGCTLPAFLVVAGSVFIGNPDLVDATRRFVEYGLGMGFVLTALTIGIAVAQDGANRATSRVLPLVDPAANAVLVLAGAYIIWYWMRNGSLL